MGAMLLGGVEATGVGAPVRIGVKGDYGVVIWFTNSGGSVTALTVDIEGKIKGEGAPDAWVQLGQKIFSGGELTAKVAHLFITGKPVDEIRANVITLTETGTSAVYAAFVESRG